MASNEATKSDVLAESIARTLETPICVVAQDRQPTDPRLTLYQTRIHFGTPENYGNCVAFAYSNNSGNAEENRAFAEKLVRAYNQETALVNALRAISDEAEAADMDGYGWPKVRSLALAALAAFRGEQA